MKKLLLIMLCLITLTGCGNEVEQKPNEPSTKQEEKVEEKYLTVELEIEKDDVFNIVKSYKVENDEQGIFNNLTIEDIVKLYPERLYESNPKVSYNYDSILKDLKDMASKHDLVIIPDYNVYLGKTTTSIVFKPQDEVKSYEDKINLNDNIVVRNRLEPTVQFKGKCVEVYSNYYGKSAYLFGGAGGDATTDKQLGMSTGNTCAINPTQDRLDKLNNMEWVKYLDKVSNGKHEQVMISRIIPLDSYKDINSLFKVNILDETSIGLVKEAHLFADGNDETNYGKYNQKEYFILDEKTCEEYNLVCDRW